MVLRGSNLATFEKLYNQALACKDGDTKIVKLFDQMLTILILSGEAVEMELPPKMAGIHKANRFGKLMVHRTVHKKGAKIVRVGFSWKLCGPDKAVAFEDDPETRSCERVTIELTSSSDRFATYTPGNVKVGSVGCGHLNQFLASVGDNVPTDEASLCEHGGSTMSSTLLCAKDEGLKKAVNTGLRWTVVNHGIEKDYPMLPSIFQRALNVEHHVGQGHA